MSLKKRHQKVMPSWLAVYYKDPLEIVEGKGCHVIDADGKSYLDFFGGILTTMTAHGVEEVVEAIQRQASKVLHTSTLYLSEPMVDLAEKIAGLSGIPDAKVFFTTSGTEANDTALLLATSHRKSNQIIALRNSYHGRSFTAQAITGNRAWSASSLSGLAVSFVLGGKRRGGPHQNLNEAEYTQACINDLKDIIDITTSGDVACMIAEPIQGVGGFCVPPDGLFGEYKKILDEYGILYITDEVQTGWGRTGENFWGYQAHGITPDILTFAKGVGNGLTLGGLVASGDLMDSLGANSISTFGGNPLSCAGALANLEYLLSNDLQANSLNMGRIFKSGLDGLYTKHDWIADSRGKGLMLALEFEVPGGSMADSAALANEFLELTKARGLLVGKGGLGGNVLRIAPPLAVNEGEIQEALNIMTEAAAEIKI